MDEFSILLFRLLILYPWFGLLQTSHPSAMDMFEEITSSSKGKQIVMFLDYDGTLSPIVDDPDRAIMSDEVGGFFFMNSCFLTCSVLLSSLFLPY